MPVARHLVLYGLAWLVLLGFSVAGYAQIFAKTCYFHSSTLLCAPELSGWQKLLVCAVVIGVLCIFVGYARTLWRSLKTGEEVIPWRRVVVFASFLGVAAVLIIPFGSSDMSYYFGAGRSIVEGKNIYTEDWEMEKVFAYPVPESVITGFSYGPIIATSFAVLYRLSGGEIVWFMLLWKILMLGALLGFSFLTYKLVQVVGRPFSKNIVLGLLLIQPMFLFEWVVNGHFDVLWLGALFAAVWAAHAKQWWLVIPCLVAGVWIKFIPVLLTPFFALWWWQSLSKEMWKRQLVETAGGLVLGVGVTVLSWYPYWTGPEVFQSVVIQSKWAVISLFAVIYYGLRPVFDYVLGAQAHWYLTRLAQGFLLVVFALFLLPYVRKAWSVIVRKTVWQTVEYVQAIFIFLLVYLFIWQKSFLPWYGAWFLPLGLVMCAAASQERARRIIAWLSIAPFAYYVLWLIEWSLVRRDAGNEWWFYLSMFLIVAVYPLYQVWQWRKKDFALNG